MPEIPEGPLQERPWVAGPWNVHHSDSAGGPSTAIHLGKHPHEGGQHRPGGDYYPIAHVRGATADSWNATGDLIALAPEMAEAILAWSFASADDLGARDAAEDLLDAVADKLEAIR